jgi:hypothetical protein
MFHCVLKYLESVANKLPGEVHQRAELLEWQLWGGHFGAITVRSWPYAARRTASAAHATGLRGNLRNYAPGSAGNEARDTDIPRRLRIRARHSWNPSVTDVIVNT